MNKFPNYNDVCEAAKRIKGARIDTPVLTNQWISNHVGAKVFFKCENMQHVGAFKFRGAYNAISRLSDAQKAAGVIAYSSGNHAQAVAKVCYQLAVEATIIMPNNAPKIKRKATESYGATVIEYDPDTQNREQIAQELNDALPKDKRLSLIPPFNHADIIAGQGTAALELMQAQPSLAQVLVPCGGGGLLSGTALAVKGINPDCKVYGVEPEMADDATQSFNKGEIVTIDYPNTIADGTRTLSVGDLTFAIMQQHVDGMKTVSEEKIKEAVRILFYHLKQVVEPSGALGLAALLSEPRNPRDKPIGIVLSGGNIDGQVMAEILAEG